MKATTKLVLAGLLTVQVACGDGAADGPDTGVPTGDSATPRDTGTADMGATDSGAPRDAAADAPVGDGGPPPDTGAPTEPTPILPAPDGPCPTFETGRQTIMDLETDILAGTPGATPGPLLITFHGTGGTGTLALNFQLPRSIRDDIVGQGGLVIAPNDNGAAREGPSPNGVWYEGSDLEYADHLVACAVMNHNIDPRRIYVTGCSAGGLMASAMAIKRSSYVAAAAPNSGGLVRTMGLSLEDPMHVPAVMTMHGGVADTVIVNFQVTSERLMDFIAGAGGFGVDCNHLSGHCGAPAALNERAWDFMQAHPFGTTPSPYASGLPGAFPSYCRIW